MTLGLRQVLMAPGMRADRVPAVGHLLEDRGLPGGVDADGEEDRLGAVRGERVQHPDGVLRPGSVVERQHDFAFAQEVVALEMFETEAGAARGVDLDGARDTERVGIARARRGRRQGRMRRGRRRWWGGRCRWRRGTRWGCLGDVLISGDALEVARLRRILLGHDRRGRALLSYARRLCGGDTGDWGGSWHLGYHRSG